MYAWIMAMRFSLSKKEQKKKPQSITYIDCGFISGEEGGIRTLETLRFTHFPGVRLRPLGHLSINVNFNIPAKRVAK